MWSLSLAQHATQIFNALFQRVPDVSVTGSDPSSSLLYILMSGALNMAFVWWCSQTHFYVWVSQRASARSSLWHTGSARHFLWPAEIPSLCAEHHCWVTSGYAGACQCLLLHKNVTKTCQQLITAHGDHVCLQFKDLPLSFWDAPLIDQSQQPQHYLSHAQGSSEMALAPTPSPCPWAGCVHYTHLCWYSHTLSKSHGRAKQSCSPFLCSFPLPTVNAVTLLLFK